MRGGRAVLLLVVLAAAACGGDDDDDGASAGSSSSEPSSYEVLGCSMAPSLDAGDRVVGDPDRSTLARGDVVLADPPEGPRSPAPDDVVRSVSRVIGLPGETVAAADGVVTVDGVRLDEEAYLLETTPDFEPVRLLPGHYFLLGDNRDESGDSREYGQVRLGLVTHVVVDVLPGGEDVVCTGRPEPGEPWDASARAWAFGTFEGLGDDDAVCIVRQLEELLPAGPTDGTQDELAAAVDEAVDICDDTPSPDGQVPSPPTSRV